MSWLNPFTSIQTNEELERFLTTEKKVLLFKHNTDCEISAHAYGQIEAFLEKKQTPAGIVIVRENRDVSNEIESRFGITHASPQLFVVEKGKVTWHASLYDITTEAIEAAFQQVANV